MNSSRLLVVGAGPTGLALALQAQAMGASVRVIDRRADAARPSRAMMVHARTLEVLRPLGVVDALLARADTTPRMRLHLRWLTVPVELAHFQVPDTAYPHLSLMRQADLEAVLADALAGRGVAVERGVELAGLTIAPAGHVEARLRGAADSVAMFDYLVGCDGADSAVRRAVGIPTAGRRYRQEVVLADVEIADLAPDGLHVAADRSGLVFLFPFGDQATWRLLATRPATGAPSGDPVGLGVLQEMVDAAGLRAQVRQVAWSSVVALRHQLADRYREGPVFLAGDAAHAHSPAGGQGMNTGIQDAVNLGWKLALAPNSAAPQTVLDSYGGERRPVARTTIALTNIVFWGEAGIDPVAALARTALVPLGAPLLPVILGCRRLAAQGFRTLAQLRVWYHDSPLSIEDGPKASIDVRAGQRLPDMPVTVASGPTRLHQLTAQPGTHLLLLADAPSLDHLAGYPGLHVHRLLDRPGRGLIAVRPDGYVGLRAKDAASPAVGRWLSLVGATAPAGTKAPTGPGRPP